jgi:hypothetical protein
VLATLKKRAVIWQWDVRPAALKASGARARDIWRRHRLDSIAAAPRTLFSGKVDSGSGAAEAVP